MKKKNYNSLKSALRSTTCISAAVMFTSLQVQSAYALPQGAQVQQGQVQFDQAGNSLTVNQSSNKAIINWQSFDIGAQESTHFAQPNANAVALNRITGSQQPSQIFGALTATGKIILINPNGVVFGPNSQVDVGGLIASTANIKDQDFLADKFQFSEAGNADARIINFGSITAKDGGLVALIAPGVENHGVISAKQGSVVLAGGQTATLDLFGDGLIHFAVDGASTGVHNQGVLKAEAGQVIMTAKAARGVVDNLVNTDGVIEASSAYRDGGSIVLGAGSGTLRVAGKVKAIGTKGGSIEMTGNTIALEAADIDASGTDAGGKIRIGGDKRGENKLQMAQLTRVDTDSVIKANATIGEGGDIAVWSSEATDFQGHVEAKGGSKGGFVEVSSTGQLGFTGSADLSAQSGEHGTLLLDPDNVIIGTRDTHDTEIADNNIISSDGSGSFYISALSVVNALNVSNVVIEALRSITVNEAIDASAQRKGSDLTLDAATITLNKDIALNSGDLNLYANSISANAGIDLKSGKLVLGTQANAGGTAYHFLLNSNGSVNAKAFEAGTLSYLTQRGSMQLSHDFNATVNTRLSATGQSVVSGTYRVAGTGQQTLADVTAKNIDVSGARVNANGAMLATTGDVKLSGDTGVSVGSAGSVTTSNGDIAVDSANGWITAYGALNADDHVTLDAQGNVTLVQTLTSGKNTTINSAASVSLRELVSVADLRVTAGRDLNISKTVTASDDVKLDAGNRINAVGALNVHDALELDSVSTTTVNMVTAKAVDIDAGYVNANGTMLTTGAITLDGDTGVVVGRAGSVHSSSGSIEMESANGGMVAYGALSADDHVTLDTKNNITLVGALTSGKNTTINSAASVSLRELVSVNNLTVTAGRDVGISKDVTAKSDVTLDAGNRVSVAGAITVADMLEIDSVANTTVNAVHAKSINIDAGYVSANGALHTTTGAITLDGDAGVAVGRAGSLEAAGGSINIDSATGGVVSYGAVNAKNNITLDAKNNVTLVETLTAGKRATINSDASVSLRETINVDTLQLSAGRDVGISKDVTATDEVTLNAGNRVTVSGAVLADDTFEVSSGSTATFNAVTAKNIEVDAGYVNANGAVVATSGTIALDGEAGVYARSSLDAQKSSVQIVSGNGGVVTQAVTAKNNLNVDAKNNITLVGTVNTGLDTILDSDASVSLRSEVNVRDVNITAARDVGIAQAVIASDDVYVNAGNRVNAAGTITAQDALNVESVSTTTLNAVTAKKIDVDAGYVSANGALTATDGALKLDGEKGVYARDALHALDGEVDIASANGGVVTQAVTADGKLTVDAKNSVTLVGAIAAGGEAKLSSSEQSISLRSDADVGDLLLTAEKNVTVSGDVTAKDDVVVNSTGNTNFAGDITAKDKVDITANYATVNAVTGKTVTADATSFTARSDVSATGGTIEIDGERGVSLRGDVSASKGSVELASQTGGVTIVGDTDAKNNVTLTAARNVTLNGTLNAGRDAVLDTDASVVMKGDAHVRDLRITAEVHAIVEGAVTATDDVEVATKQTTIFRQDVVAADKVEIDAHSAVVGSVTGKSVTADAHAFTANGDVTATGGAVHIDGERGVNLKGNVSATKGGATIESATGGVSVAGDIAATGNVGVDAKSNITVKGTTTGKNVEVASERYINMNGAEATGGDVTFETDHVLNITGAVIAADDVSLNAALGIRGGADVSAKDKVDITTTRGVALGGVATQGNITVDADHNVAFDGDVTAKNLTVDDKANTVSLLGNTNVSKDLDVADTTRVTIGGEINAANLNINLDVITVANPQMDIQYAVDLVNDGGRVYIAGGTYTQHSLNLNRGITLQGAGSTRTTIDATGGAHGIIVGGDADGARIYNLTVSGASQSGISVDTKGTELTRLDMSGVNLSNNGGSGLEVTAQSDVGLLYLNNSALSNNADDGLTVAAGADVSRLLLRNATFAENADNGVEIEQGATANNLDIATTKFLDNADAGVLQTKGLNNTIRTSEFSGNARGLVVESAKAGDVNWLRAYDNQFGGNQAQHIALSQSVDIRNKANRTVDTQIAADTVRDTLSAENQFETLVDVSAEENGAWQAQHDSYALYGTIAQAANDAASGDWLNIAAGDYNEHITLDKALTLNGVGSKSVRLGNTQGAAITLDTSADAFVSLKGLHVDGGDTGLLIAMPAGGFGMDDVRFSDQLVSAVFFRNATREYSAADVADTIIAKNTALVASDYKAPLPAPVVAARRNLVSPAPAVQQNTIFTQIAQQGVQQNRANQSGLTQQPTVLLTVDHAGQSQDNTVTQDIEKILQENDAAQPLNQNERDEL